MSSPNRSLCGDEKWHRPWGTAVAALLASFVVSMAAAASRAVPSASAHVIWKADAELSMASEWASNSSIPWATSPPLPDPSRIYQSSARAQGLRSYHFELRNGDYSYGERAELGQALPALTGYAGRWFRAGEERWIAMRYYIPGNWPMDPRWQTILQIKPVSNGGGGAVIGLNATNQLTFVGNSNAWGSTSGGAIDGAGPLAGGGYAIPKDRWIKLTWHVMFSADPCVGWLEVYGDLGDYLGMRTLVPWRRRATMKYRYGVMDPVHLRVGIYRDPTMWQTQALRVDGITVATTRAEAEANAYRGPF